MAIEEVHPRIYKIPSVLGPRRFAQWLVVGDERLLLIDSGIDGTIGEHVTPALRELGRSPADITDVVVTHADVDHYGGNGELRRVAPQARIRSSAEDRPWIESWSMISRERYGWYRGHRLDYDDGTWQWLEQAAGPDTPLDGTVADGETIDLGGIVVEIVALPGHSPGHVGVAHHDSQHPDRDGRGARTRAVHDLRRADQPASVRICRGLPGNYRTSAVAVVRPGSAPATTRRSTGTPR